MGNYSTRLGCTLSFNEESEKDIIRLVEQLQGSRKIGEFIGYLIRVASENPELIDKRPDGSFDYGPVTKEMSRLGVTPTRYQYIQTMAKEIDSMKQKIDSIYEMSLKMYTLAQFGKQMGLSKRSDNMLMASFLAEQELTKLCKTFGVGNLQSVFASSKMETAHNKANDTLQYILETYDSIVNELKETLFKEVEIKAKPIELEVEPVKLDIEPIKLEVSGYVPTGTMYDTNENRQEDKDEYDEEIDFGSIEKDEELEETKIKEELEDETIDFGNAAFDLLENFFAGE